MNSKRRTLWSRMFAADAQNPGLLAGTVPEAAPPAGLASSLRPLALEQRFMFDGAGAVDVAHAVVDAGAHAPEAQADNAWLHALALEPAVPAQRQEVVFVDGSIANYQQLVNGLQPGTEVVVLDGTMDGLQQIASYLDGRSGIDALHILSHGHEAQITLGTLTLDQATLDKNAETLARIGGALADSGDILLYGCVVADGDAGDRYIAQWAALTQADIAASTDATGAAALGGNWVLEKHIGQIEADKAISESNVAAYDGLLLTGYGTQDGTWDFGGQLQNAGGGFKKLNDKFLVSDAIVQEGNMLFVNPELFSQPDVGRTFTVVFKAEGTVNQHFTFKDFTFSTFTSDPSYNQLKEFKVVLADSGGTTLATYEKPSGALVLPPSGGTLSSIANGGVPISVANVASVSITFAYQHLTPGDLNFESITVADIWAAPPNAAPVIANLNGDAVTYVEDSAYVLLDAGGNAVVTDADSANFNGGKLTVRITAGGTAGEDVLFIRDQGPGANQIVVSGASILYNGLVIGTFTGGSNGNPMVVTFTSDANPTTVSALVQNLAYRNSNTIEPSTTPRTVSISMDDGAGGSSTVATVGIEVHPVNDMPVVVNITATNPTYTENASAVQLFSGAAINTIESGQSVVQLVFTVSGVANGAAEKLVIDGTDVVLVQGTNVTTVINGVTVKVSVSGGTASVTLDKAAGLSTATAQAILNSMAYRNDSESPNTANRVVTLSTVSDNGGSADGGQPTATVGITSTVTVVGINDAPILSGGPYNFASINEDTTATGVRVSTVLANHTMVDPDASAQGGVAVIAKTGRGTWQYSTDNATWTDFGAVSNTSALLLAATTYVRYVPDAANGETATLTFRGWDQTMGTASVNGIRGLADTTSHGGTSAFSVGTGAVNQIVTSVNDAPVMIPVAPTLNGLTDTATNSNGALVSDLLGGVTDVDTGALKGMAITGLTATYGKWQYSINAGGTWSDVGAVSVTSALILTAQNSIRFVPDGIHGETATISYKAWDQTNSTLGLQGAKVNTTTSGGTSAYSSATDTATVVVTAINDRPVVSVSGAAAIWTEGNNVASSRSVVDSAVTVSDADGPNPLSATVRLLTYYSAQDTLAFANDGLTMGNIVGTWSAGTGILTLSSAGNQATTAQFQAAMRAVTYGNSSDTPNTTSRTVQFQVTDGGGLSSIAVTRDITIVAVNDSPTISAPASLQLNEDIPTALGNITFSDVDSTTGTVTFSVGTGTLGATGAGGVTVGGTSTALTLSGTLANINQFIANNRLVYTPAANASGDVTLTINVNTTSVSDATTTMTLQVTAVNDAPAATVPPSITVTEDVASVITGISFTDVDAGINVVTATFSVPSGTLQATTGMGVTVAGSGTGELTLSGSLSDINFFISANGLRFKTAQDATASVQLTVTVNDRGNSGTGGEQTNTKTVTLNVTAVNDAPVNNVPAAQTVGQGIALGFNTASGNAISISDVDAGNGLITVTLTAVNGTLSLGSMSGINLVWGTGVNNVTMSFEGNRANLNAALQTLSFRGASGYIGAASITIETNDNGNSGTGGAKSDVDTVSINVVPVNPKITSVAAQGLDRTVKVGDEVLVNMVFDQAVNVDTAGGTPTLLLETGLVDRSAVYQSGSGTNTLVFKYTVQAGDISADLDFQSTAALQLNGAVISNSTSDLAVLTLPTVGGADSLGGRSSIVVDGVVPVVGSVGVPAAGTYVAGQNLDFSVNFSEAITLDTSGGTPRIAVTLDTGGTVYASYVSGSGSSALVFRMTVASGQLDANGISVGTGLDLNGGRITDLAGNAAQLSLNSVGSTSGVLIDAIGPTATITLDDTALRAGETAQVTIAFNEAVRGLDRADFDVSGGTLSNLASADGGRTWTATFSPDADVEQAVNTIRLRSGGVMDAAGNANGAATSGNYAIDTRLPTASIVVADTALRLGETSLVTITFSEAVTGFTNADLTVANGSLSAVTSSDGGITWTATFMPDANVTDTSNLIVLDNTGVADLAGNAGSGVSTSNNYAIDTLRPTATIVVADNALAAGETSLVTITFSEAVTGFTRADLTVANGTLSAVSSSDGGITWTATLTPNVNVTDTSNVITLDNTGVADLAGNAGSGTTDSNNYAIDNQRPTASIVVADNALAAGETSLVTITFSEAVTGFSNADLSVANGTLSAVSSSDGGITWTATFTPDAEVTDTTNLITLDNTGVADLAGNVGTGMTTSNNYAIDTQRPAATIVIADTALAVGQTSLVTITFSEAVTGFTNADLTVANGSLSAVTSSDGGITWTATFMPDANVTDTSNLIVLDNTGVADLAGNAGSGTTQSNNYAIDTRRPTATIAVADSALAAGETSLVTISFSEAVTGFTNADLSVANGTLTDVESRDGGITWTATFTPNANITDAKNLITLDNSGVADLAGNAGSGTTDSNNYAIDNQRPTASIVVADNALAAGETSLVTITFSEAVTGFSNADLSVANGTLSAVSSSDGGITWTATFTPDANVTGTTNLIVLDNTGVADLAGNAGGGTTESNNYAIDTLRPTGSIVIADSALRLGETSLVTITFSEAVTGFSNADLTVANGTLTEVQSRDGGITWTATFTPTSDVTDATNLITLDNSGVADLAGNAGSGTTQSNNYAIDTRRPTATIAVADSALAAGETSLVTISFSEAVTGFTNADLSVANGTLTDVESRDGGITWTATFTPNANITDAKNLITLDNAGVADLAGNAGSGTTQSNNYAIDTQRPTATITVADTALQSGETTEVTIAFSEAVNGLELSDFDVANGSLSDLATANGGLTWTAVFTPGANVEQAGNAITLRSGAVSDAAGNAIDSATPSNGYAIDTRLPTARITVADTALKAGETAQVSIVFSERVQGLDLADFTVAHGTLSDLRTQDGITWTATLTPNAGVQAADNRILLNNAGYTDLAGNSGVGSTPYEGIAIDTQLPTASIVLQDGELLAGMTTEVTIVFSEPVQGLDLSDFTVPNGTLSDLRSTDGITWKATLTPANDVQANSNLIRLNNAGYTDLAGNTGVGETGSDSYAVATAPVPNATMAPAPIALPTVPGLASVQLSPVQGEGTSSDFGFLSPANDNALLSPLSSPLALALAGFSELPLATRETVSPETAQQAAQAPYVPQPIPRTAGAPEGLQLLRSVNDLSIGEGGQLAWKVPANVFGHTNPLAVVSLSMTLADGRPLPQWVRFDARTGTLQVQLPEGWRGDLVLQLTARDNQGNEVKTTVRLKPGAQAAARAGLAEQFQRAALQRAGGAAGHRLQG
ncbi:Ig-like domain-containing protein [Comamonas antarctica]|uniref:Ig-like domain-containing protein n=1 Tax=Comamonas antarctica TaxID=2743470 RepID=UPI0028EDFE97|nr:Ig-like domain-containing protein [Comamonas antarctica]